MGATAKQRAEVFGDALQEASYDTWIEVASGFVILNIGEDERGAAALVVPGGLVPQVDPLRPAVSPIVDSKAKQKRVDYVTEALERAGLSKFVAQRPLVAYRVFLKSKRHGRLMRYTARKFDCAVLDERALSSAANLGAVLRDQGFLPEGESVGTVSIGPDGTVLIEPADPEASRMGASLVLKPPALW